MAYDRILTAYTSKRGSARQAADWIAEELGGNVDVIDLASQSEIDLGLYDTIVLGTGIVAGKAYKPLTKFIERRRRELKSKDICLFITHLEEGDGIERDFESAFDEEFLNSVRVRIGVGGRLRISQLNFFIRMIFRQISKKSGKDFTEYDTLSRERCASFAEQVRSGIEHHSDP